MPAIDARLRSLLRRPLVRDAAGIGASALLAGLYARGGAAWPLGFVLLVPWLRASESRRGLARTLLGAWAMSVAYALAVFAWFGVAVGDYTQLGAGAGIAALVVGAPLFQPQILAFAAVRYIVGYRHGATLRAVAGAAAWVATEWAVPRLLGDTLGDGLYPSRVLRQAADVGGAAGLTLLLLLANEAVSAAIGRRRGGLRAIAVPLALAAAGPLLLAGYGAVALGRASAAPAPADRPLRVALVQADIVDYERLRRERGAGAVVREVLDVHEAMSYDAVEHQHADAVLWPETVYPTTFGHPKSDAGAALDREILGFVDAARVPFAFGTYDSDAAGEYNAAAFVEPGRGLLGFYRKSRPFPLTEAVPAWLDGPALRRWLPWAGTWRAGSGARVFPLRLADGREIPVLPLICLDDTDPQLAIDGARLGARAILTLSNDAWFSGDAQGATLHLGVAALRSVETRLPQFRATTNGISAAIDATGTVIAASRRGEPSLVIGALPVPAPPRTLMVIWGDWVGRAAAAGLALLAVLAATARRGRADPQDAAPAPLPADVQVLPRAARMAAGALRVFSRGGLLWMIAAVLLGDAALQSNTLAQVRTFVAIFVVPEAAAWCLLRAFTARARVVGGALQFVRGRQVLELALDEIAAVEPWRVPVPGPGVSLRLASGEPWRYALGVGQPAAFARALTNALTDEPANAGVLAAQAPGGMRAMSYASARQALRRHRLDRPLAKFVALPLALAIPAFRLHQHIAYGSALGEFYTFGLKAYATTFALWWAAWTIGVVLWAAALRTAIEAGSLAGVWLAPGRALDTRRALERAGLAALYLGLPAWLAFRIFGG